MFNYYYNLLIYAVELLNLIVSTLFFFLIPSISTKSLSINSSLFLSFSVKILTFLFNSSISLLLFNSSIYSFNVIFSSESY